MTPNIVLLQVLDLEMLKFMADNLSAYLNTLTILATKLSGYSKMPWPMGSAWFRIPPALSSVLVALGTLQLRYSSGPLGF